MVFDGVYHMVIHMVYHMGIVGANQAPGGGSLVRAAASFSDKGVLRDAGSKEVARGKRPLHRRGRV